MRVITLIGIVLIALGGFVLVRTGGSVQPEKELLKVGDVELTTREHHTIPPWGGAIAVALGVICVVSGTTKRD